MYMYMYEVDRVYGLTESGKNLSLSLSLFLPGLGWVGPWEWGARERKQLNTKKKTPPKMNQEEFEERKKK